MITPPGATISAMFAQACATHRDRVAIQTSDRTWTYAALKEEVHRMATAYARLGIAPRDRVGIWLPNSPEWIVSALALIQLRATIVPVNARLRAAEMGALMAACPMRAIITTDRFLTNHYLDALDDLRTASEGPFPTVVALRGAREGCVDYGEIHAAASPRLSPEARAHAAGQDVDDLVSAFWTSGSTGDPKGVLTTHRVLENLHSYCERMGMVDTDRCLVSSPLFYIAGFNWCMLAPLLVGASIIPLSMFTAEEILDSIEEHRATVWVGVAHSHATVINHPSFTERELSSVRAVYAGGAALSLPDARRLVEATRLERFISVYGLTEAGGIATMTRPDDPLPTATSTIGFPLPSFEVRCVDPDTLRVVPADETGEIWLRTPYLSPGYLAANGTVTPLELEDGWFRTGDLGRMDADGRLTFVSRLKDIIKVNGENVSPAEVERVLMQHPAVQAACVVAIPDDARGEIVGAAVVPSDRDLADDDLLAFCRQRLAPFKVPRALLFLESLPTTSAGKPAAREVAQLVSGHVRSR
jgi:HIP---CoA ligase